LSHFRKIPALVHLGGSVTLSRLDDLDAEKVRAEYAKAKAAVDSAADDAAKADATLAMDTAKAMGVALGLAL